jgi:hypothetical protein
MDEKTRTLGPKAALVTQTVAAILTEISCLAPTLLQPTPSALAGED